MDTKAVASQVSEVLRAAVDTRLRSVVRPISATHKADGSIVTDIDVAIERDLISGLTSIVNCPVLAEESERDAIEGGLIWVIDPIDGTANFVANLEFSSSVALCESTAGQIGRTLVGAIYAPDSGTQYVAWESSAEAYRITDEMAVLRISANDRLGDSIAIFGVPYDRAAIGSLLGMIRGVAEVARDVKRMGPASLDICKIAEGRCEAYVERDLKPWDYAAARLILEKAGGRLETIDGFTIVTNGVVRDEFVEALHLHAVW